MQGRIRRFSGKTTQTQPSLRDFRELPLAVCHLVSYKLRNKKESQHERRAFPY